MDRLAKYPRCVLVNPKYRPVVDSVRMVRKALKDDRCVPLTMYPEGMMPFTGAQMPFITKEGAHVIARKLAIELSGSDRMLNILCAKPLPGSMTYAAEPFGVLKARECVE